MAVTKETRFTLTRSLLLSAAWSLPALASAQPAAPVVSQLEELVVTAQRRGENLQDVPISVTAVTAETASRMGAGGTLDLPLVAPAVTFGANIGGARITIRGIGGAGAAGDESANAVYIDGVYMAYLASQVTSFNNIARIEVLKGPQGTLFGRNASGGLVQIITREPSTTPSASVSVGYSNYSTLEGSFYGTTGITDDLAIDLAIYGKDQRGGWGRNVVLNREAYTGWFGAQRASAMWTPSDATKLRVTAMFSDTSNPAFRGGQVIPGEIVPNTLVTPSSATGGRANVGFYDTTNDQAFDFRFFQNNYSYNFSQDLGFATLVNIGSWDRSWGQQNVDNNYSNAPGGSFGKFTRDSHSWTQELQLVSPETSKVKWIVGGFYFDKYESARFVVNRAVTAFNAGSNVRSRALYGQATVPVLERTSATVGLRHSSDDTSGGGLAPGNVTVGKRERTDSKWTYRLALDHKFSDDILGYVSYTTGFKSGFFNVTNIGQAAVTPQSVETLEGGVKATLFDRRARINASVYSNKFDNIQIRGFVLGGSSLQFLNAGEGESKGIDVDFDVVVTNDLTLHGGLTTIDSEYTRYDGAPLFAVDATGVLRAIGSGSVAGKKMINAPKLATTISADYEVPVDFAEVVLSASWNHNDGYFFDAQNRVAQPSYDLVNLALSISSLDDNWQAKLFVNNLLKENYYASLDVTAGVGDVYFPASPRVYGIQLTRRWP